MPEMLLVTSRETHRWIVPKGWPMKGLKDHKAAAIEALEEAGVRGALLHRPVGRYSYWRRTTTDFRLTMVDAYAMRVERHLKRWKEMAEREQRWLDLFEAADLVAEPELSTLIMSIPSDMGIMDFLARSTKG